MSAPHFVTSRRTALGGALAGLVTVAGCDDDTGSAPRPGPMPAPPPDADADLVDDVIDRIVETIPVVVAARRQDPDLKTPLRPLAKLHDAHLEALDAPSGLKIAARPTADLKEVRFAESALQGHLTDAAVAAESGALAQLLASMAAAVAQHLAVLP